jgi:hypothetical protein
MIGPAMAQSYDLVQNGNFTELATQTSSEFGSLYSGQQVTDWSTSGYNFVFLPNTADSTGAVGQFSTLKLWGPGSGSANGFTATAPGGGNIIGGDGAYQVGAVSQTLTGLKVGDTIAVKFDWAGAQQSGYTTSTTENWKVSLGSSSQTTATVNNAAKGFTGWMGETFDFVATSSSETLSFLAAGTPNGQPPFSLLSNVSAQDITEHPMNPAPLPALGATPFGVLACAAVAAGKLRRKRARSA